MSVTTLRRGLLGLSGGAPLLFLAVAPLPTKQEESPGYKNTARPFLDQYCLPCHQGTGAKGSFRADSALTSNFADRALRAKWAEAVNALNRHQMPPKDSLQPSAAEVGRFVDWVRAETVRVEKAQRERGGVLRRLTRDEYKNSVRELTGVDFDVSGFPADPPAGGFDNNARALTVSPLHVELYAKAARQILDQALVSGTQPPKILWHFDPKTTAMDSRRVQLDEKNRSVIVNGGKNTEEGEWIVVHHESWDKGVDARNFAVPVEGSYTVRLRAAARIPTRQQVTESAAALLAQRRDTQLRQNPQGARYHHEAFERDLNHFRTDPIYSYGPPRVKLVQHLGSQPRTVAEIDVEEAPQVYSFPVRFTTQPAGLNFHYAYDLPRVLENFWCQSAETFARPELKIDWFEIEGPNFDAWPPSSHTRILFDSPLRLSNERAYAREVLARFMRRAYRRPVATPEVDAKLALYDRTRQAQPFLEAIKVPLTAVLASPNFLFLMERAGPRELTDHELAARLSYFLWGSLPDPTLSALADSGKLHEPTTLRQQTQRLLKDARSQELVRRFTGQWLGLGQVGANPPATDLFPAYDRHYEVSIVQESEAFFTEILQNDLDATNLIKSDFVVVNERLARAYGIPNVKGDHFRRVPVPQGVHRGGIPTQAAILTITSNGTRTSPVKRGTWIMKTLLGTDPGLPVADAGEIAARVPGIEKATVRKRLEIHRTRAQCARCHSKIDPLGFALENFDAAGLWRDREGFGYKGRVEPNDPLVDAASQLPNGTKLVGVEGLQAAILAQPNDFFACLASKMLTFALGRELGLTDEPLVQKAVAQMNQNGQTLRSLIEFIVLSEAFRTK